MIKISTDMLLEAIEEREQCLTNPGFCIACGFQADGVEPDARGYECESCGENKVYSPEEILLGII